MSETGNLNLGNVPRFVIRSYPAAEQPRDLSIGATMPPAKRKAAKVAQAPQKEGTKRPRKGDTEAVEEAHDSASTQDTESSKKAGKKPKAGAGKAPKTLSDKVLAVVGEGKASLAGIKKALSDQHSVDLTATRVKTQLKKVLQERVAAGDLLQVGGSYTHPDYVEPTPHDEDAEDDGGFPDGTRREAYAGKARWLGLSVKQRDVAKTAQSKCRHCGVFIEKGMRRVKVSDSSLFKALDTGGHEGSYRGYIEAVGSLGIVSREIFFLHVECLADADTEREAKFWEYLETFESEGGWH